MLPRLRPLALIGALLVLAGCDADPTGIGSGMGEVRAVAVSTGSASPDARGTVSFDAAVTLISSTGAEVPLGGGGSTEIGIRDSGGTAFASGGVAPGTYTRARVTFSRVSGSAEGNVVVGGRPFLGSFDVAIPSPVVVEAPVQIVVDAGSTRDLVVDLNATDWLAEMDLTSRRVSASAFRSKLTVNAG